MWRLLSWLANWRRRFTWNSLTVLRTVTKLDYSAKASTVSNNRLVISIVVSTMASFVSVSSNRSWIHASTSTLTLVLSLQSGWTTFFYSAPVSIRSTPSRRHLRKVQHERCWRVSILPRYSGQSRSHQQDDYH